MKKRILVIMFGFVLGVLGEAWSVAGETGGATGQEEPTPANKSPNHSRMRAVARAGTTAASALKDIQFSFRLDQRLTRSLYMGDRWVSPKTYTRVGEGKECPVEVRAYGVTPQGQQIALAAKWVSADPEVVTVAPGPSSEVRLTVKRAGETTVTVGYEQMSRKLSIKAVPHGDSLLVDITSAAPEAAIPKSGLPKMKQPQTSLGTTI